MILVGDIGGTKVNLAQARARDGRWEFRDLMSYASRSHEGFDGILREYLPRVREPLEAACFGVAGAVLADECLTTNLPWTVRARDIRALLGTENAHLINDLVAAALGVPVVSSERQCVLQEGVTQPRGPIGLIAAGTGLGMALLLYEEGGYRAVCSEGGHADFAPAGDEEIDLLRFLRRRFGHVSWERVLSGPGIRNLFDFLLEKRGGHDPAAPLVEAAGDPAATISRLAQEGKSPLCRETLRLFARLYGAAAGNLALSGMTTGGVYLAGGIAPKNLGFLQDEDFLKAFRDKGRMGRFAAQVPVRVVLDELLSLSGAAQFAARRAR